MTLRPGSGQDSDWRGDVLRFWFGLDPKQWWTADPALDRQIKEGFGNLWSEKRQLPARSFLDDPLTALAAVTLFDQFPRNMFRGHADQFATDTLALGIARAAVHAKFDDQLEAQERGFLYMPFEHSEDLADQNRAVELIGRLGNARWLDYAIRHRAVVARFGRFPHRNVALGRASTPEEEAFLAEPDSSF